MLTIKEIQTESAGGHELVSAKIRLDDLESHLWFRWRGTPCPNPGDVLLLATLLPTMRNGVELEIPHPLSRELIDTLEEVQQHFCDSESGLNMVKIRTRETSREYAYTATGQSLTGILFDGGVDAFFTFHKNQDEIHSIVFVSDYEGDVELHHKKGTAIKSAKERASDLGKPFIEVQTNLRHFLRTFDLRDTSPADLNTIQEVNETLLIAIIDTLLSGHLEKLVVPGDRSHPLHEHSPHRALPVLIDSLLPGNRVHVHHHDADIEHEDKIESLKSNGTILEALRVCWENTNRSYNCGRCRKCTRRISANRLVELLSRDSNLLRKRFRFELQET
jgi:hypothetical protein